MMGHGGLVPGTLLRDQVLRTQVNLDLMSSEFPINPLAFRTGYYPTCAQGLPF